jgi:hypothetical protein
MNSRCIAVGVGVTSRLAAGCADQFIEEILILDSFYHEKVALNHLVP